MSNQSNSPGLRPIYPFEPIHGLPALSRALGIHPNILIKYSQCADRLYRVAKQEKKPDGTFRQTFDAYPVLKSKQTRPFISTQESLSRKTSPIFFRLPTTVWLGKSGLVSWVFQTTSQKF